MIHTTAQSLLAIHVKRGCAGQGPRSQGIIQVVWRCTGREANLLECNNQSRECDHRRDAGVYCSGEMAVLLLLCKNILIIRSERR